MNRFNETESAVFQICRFSLYQGRTVFYTVKSVLNGPLKRRLKLVFKTDNRLMQVKSIAECSKRAFCNTFDRH